jgi:hypothetical protein
MGFFLWRVIDAYGSGVDWPTLAGRRASQIGIRVLPVYYSCSEPVKLSERRKAIGFLIAAESTLKHAQVGLWCVVGQSTAFAHRSTSQDCYQTVTEV